MEPTTGPLGGSENEQSPVPPPPPAVDEDGAAIARFVAAGRRSLYSRAKLPIWSSTIRLASGGFIALALGAAYLPGLDVRSCAVLAIGSLLVGVGLARRAARERASSLAVALALRTTDPELSDELRSLLELDVAARAGRLQGGAAFLVLLRRRIGPRLTSKPFSRSRERRALTTAVAVAVTGLAIVGLLVPRLYSDLLSTLRRGRIAAPPTSDAPPIIGDLELELHPPAYTGLPMRLLPSSSGDVRVLRGTEIVLRARSLVGAVRKVELRVELDGGKPRSIAGEVTRRAIDDATPILTARLTVAGPGSYRFALSRWTGRAVEPVGHRLEIDPDAPPRVDLRAPAELLGLATPRPVELAFEAEDDFGIGDLALVFKVNGGAEQRLELTPDRPTPRRARGRYLWELGELEREGPLPQNTQIEYFVEARDNDAVLGAKAARSRTLKITLRGKNDPASIDRAELEAVLEETLAALADRLEGQGGERQHAALAALAGRYEGIAKAPASKSATPALRKLAGEIAARLIPLVAEEAHAARGVGDKVIAELERDVLALDDLRGRRRLEEMARLGDEMKRGRDQLKRLFEELRTASSDAQKAELRREIERRLTELEAKMAELRKIAAQAEHEVPDEFLNREALGKRDINNGVDSIRQMLERGDLEKAAAELERMSKSLDQLAGSMQKDLRSFSGQRDPEREKANAALENDLADLAREQREIEQESRAIRDRAGKEAEARGGSLKALHDKVRGKLAELDRKGAEQASDGRMVDPELLALMRARAKAVGRALESNDLDEAQGMALDARRMAAGMSERLREIEAEREAEAQARVADGPSPGLRRSGKRMAEVEAIARQVEAELARTDSARSPSLGDADRKRVDELSKRQQRAAQRAEELSRRQQGMGDLPQGVGNDVEGARQQIAESGRQLARPAPGRGAEAAGQAAERLDAARMKVAESRQSRPSGDPGDEQQRQKDEKILIPGADDSAAPRAFREELLDAMKRGAPRRFEEQARKFYEELVR